MCPERVALALAPLLLAAGCARDWRTDMWFQPSLRAEDAPRPEPEGSVPLGAPLVRWADRDETQDLVAPFRANDASLARGQALFRQRCAPCHGAEGHGGGPVSRYFPAAPDLASPTVRARSDGYIFGTITFGGRAMPPQREGLTERDRWDLVNHVRAIQGRTPTP
jgi:mono/diheme cytochrome c family protein